ncbi:MAG: hypothetical protein ACRERY_04385, partial [Pseudomonas sp.]
GDSTLPERSGVALSFRGRRDLALLTVLAGLKNPDDEFGTELQKEISRLHPDLSELELRIRRSVVFAPLAGGPVTKTANECIVLTGALVASMQGNTDEIIEKMNEFNTASRKAHAEILGINIAEQGAQVRSTSFRRTR